MDEDIPEMVLEAEIDEVVEEAITIEIDTLVVEDADWVELHPLVELRELEDSSAEPEDEEYSDESKILAFAMASLFRG